MFTAEEYQDKPALEYNNENKLDIPRPYTLHIRNTFFNVGEITILRRALDIKFEDDIVYQIDFLNKLPESTVRKIFLRLCVLGFFSKLPPTDKYIPDPFKRELARNRVQYKVHTERVTALLAKLRTINDIGLIPADKSVIIASARLHDIKKPITTSDLILNTTLSGSNLVQWCRGNKDLIQRVQTDLPNRAIHHYFTKKIRIIARAWEDITKMVSLHSKMK